MAKKTIFAVFHTTESGADYKVSPAFKDRSGASSWEHENRDNYERPLIIRKITF